MWEYRDYSVTFVGMLQCTQNLVIQVRGYRGYGRWNTRITGNTDYVH